MAPFTTCEPWLPPPTRTTRAAAGRPSASRPFARVHCSRPARTGFPVTTTLSFAKKRSSPGNVAAMRRAKRARRRFTRPGTASPFQTTIGTPRIHAARTTGSETSPPEVSSAWGRARNRSHHACATASGSTSAARTSDRRDSGSRSDGMSVRWNSMPRSGISVFSRPRLPPTKTKRQGLDPRSASLTARSGLV